MKERQKDICFTDMIPSHWQNEGTGGHAGVFKMGCTAQGVSKDTCVYKHGAVHSQFAHLLAC